MLVIGTVEVVPVLSMLPAIPDSVVLIEKMFSVDCLLNLDSFFVTSLAILCVGVSSVTSLFNMLELSRRWVMVWVSGDDGTLTDVKVAGGVTCPEAGTLTVLEFG